MKTYGLKNDDGIESNLPKIRPVQARDNPIVERVTNADEGPEFNVKHKKASKKPTDDGKKSAMNSLLSLLEGSFGNFLSDASDDGEKKIAKSEKESGEKRKSRRSVPDDDNKQQERVFSVSFQVGEANEPKPQTTYRRGTVISEKLGPFEDSADSAR